MGTCIEFISAIIVVISGFTVAAVTLTICSRVPLRKVNRKKQPTTPAVQQGQTGAKIVRPSKAKGDPKRKHGATASPGSSTPPEQRKATPPAAKPAPPGPTKNFKPLTPREFPKDAREIRIAKGLEYREKGEYPTIADVLSDWDSTVRDAAPNEPAGKSDKNGRSESERGNVTVLNVTKRENLDGMNSASNELPELPEGTSDEPASRKRATPAAKKKKKRKSTDEIVSEDQRDANSMDKGGNLSREDVPAKKRPMKQKKVSEDNGTAQSKEEELSPRGKATPKDDATFQFDTSCAKGAATAERADAVKNEEDEFGRKGPTPSSQNISRQECESRNESPARLEKETQADDKISSNNPPGEKRYSSRGDKYFDLPSVDRS